MSSNTEAVAFTESTTRADEMRESTEAWLEDLSKHVGEARASDEFREWLDTQSRFQEYSHRNTLLIKQQRPEATKVAGYRTWQREFDRQVCEGESAIWIWAPIIARQCPSCGNSAKHHERTDCDESTSDDEWPTGLVGFKPASVFDVSQTEGEPLPSLKTTTLGDADDLLGRLLDAAEDLEITVSVVPATEWTHGEATGVCKRFGFDAEPLIEVCDRANEADLAGTLIHEYAHALLHFDVNEEVERAKREVEAEAVAYIVGRYSGLDVSGSAFYLAAWQSDAMDVLIDRLGRISQTAATLIEAIED